jgi:hypothetical protein
VGKCNEAIHSAGRRQVNVAGGLTAFCIQW